MNSLEGSIIGLVELGSFEIVTRMLLSLLLGILTALQFRLISSNDKPQEHIYLALVLCPPIVAMALMSLGNSLATAFGLFAALSIIRFRTPIKNIKEMIFIFFSLVCGISSGVGAFKITIISTLIILITMALLKIIFKYIKSNQDYILILTLKDGKTDFLEKLFSELILKHDKIQLVEVKKNDNALQVIYDLKTKKLEKVPYYLNELNSNESIENVIVQKSIL